MDVSPEKSSWLTVRERKALAAGRRADALFHAERAVAALAKDLGGRFWVFGSVARGRDCIHGDSDIDLIAEFPDALEEIKATYAAEDLVARIGLPCDAHAKREISAALWSEISADVRRVAV